jgi:hypothetical protein
MKKVQTELFNNAVSTACWEVAQVKLIHQIKPGTKKDIPTQKKARFCRQIKRFRRKFYANCTTQWL